MRIELSRCTPPDLSSLHCLLPQRPPRQAGIDKGAPARLRWHTRTCYRNDAGGAVHLAYTTEQDALRRELREYFATLMTPDRRAGLENGGEYGDGEAYKDIVWQMGRDGWLSIGWPQEYGGQARPMLDQLIFTAQAAVGGVPGPF